ncbi:alpha/beta hydrolase [candidate division TA06 bacterium SM1_40]|uniref:Alpha/beta hydrolase n=1 Tax=candidate division TA06 bacterium SM1_40 TaxID=1703773 RepID=A0A0S8JGH6_UNCT6|nr:MAG: alpha/beta hydrolase [candidate division TA06 bacterium SM1_40]
MENLRKYGRPPFAVVVVHGGPGARGEMAPVARELASSRGVLEPLQTATSLEGQVEELRAALEKHADLPVTLIGFSWGAWLSFVFAARYPAFARKLIVVGSGPYEEKYAARILETRLGRLKDEERIEVRSVIDILDNPKAENRSSAFERLGVLFAKADAYDPIPGESIESGESVAVGAQADIFLGAWKDGAELRRSGKLLELGRQIECPVVAIHGEYDPHPAEGVRNPLCATLEDFRFVLLENCGHKPWVERNAGAEFFRILKQELR